MLYDASRAGNATEDIFDSAAWQAKGRAQQTPAGRGSALFIDRDSSPGWVLRHYRRGGFIANLSQDRYFWTGESRTRPFREWRLLHELHHLGLPVPAPVAAIYHRSGPTYSGALITERIPGAEPLSAFLTRAPLPTATWETIGRILRRFHDAGVCHADLNAHNILIGEPTQIFMIDFDRGRRRPPGAWQMSNLARLRRSLQKISRDLPSARFSDAEWQTLLRAYRT